MAADGTFNPVGDGWETVETVGALTITTTYNSSFEKQDVTVEKRYDDVKALEQMSSEFQAAWAEVTDYLPVAFLNEASPVQFATDGGHTVVIATADAGDISNGDVIGRISEWDNTGSWTRWFGDEELDVESSEWNFNFHTSDWTHVASAGGRNVSLVNLVDGSGADLPDEPEEVGTRVSSIVHKEGAQAVAPDTWSALQSNYLSDNILDALETGLSWEDVKYLEISEENWSSVENSYRSADELWSDGELRYQLHGIKSDPNNIEYLGSVTVRDGFIMLRDSSWNEVARLIDPTAASEDTSYDAMLDIYGDSFEAAWSNLAQYLPESVGTPQTLLYSADGGGDIFVFKASGEMIAKMHHWSHDNTWDMPWDDNYASQTWSNKNYDIQVIQTNGSGWNWMQLGRYETGTSALTDNNGVTETESSWEQVSSTAYERSFADSPATWASLEGEYFLDVVTELSTIDGWADVDRIEISENEQIYYPVAWRDETELENSTDVRFYSETDAGGWFRDTYLGSMQKRDGFIEIRDANWNIVKRVVDLSDASQIKNWNEIKLDYTGIEEAWDSVKPFFADVQGLDGSGNTAWVTNPLVDPINLKFTTDDNQIYAFTAAGTMVAQINFWSNTDEWTGFYGNDERTIKNINYNYNFHDEDWNQIANAGGNLRYIVEADGGLELDEVGSNVGFMQRKADVSDVLWATYDPNDTTGTITFADVVEVRYETRSWKSVENDYRGPNEQWSDSSVQIQYYETVPEQNWTDFVGSKEERDGFVEIRDEHWNVVSKKVDGGDTYLQVVTKYPDGFANAWKALSDKLPADWVATSGTPPKPAYEDFLYTVDKWDNILIFDATGEMIGQVSYWSHTDTWDRPWDPEFPTQTHTNSNFHFQKIDVGTGGNWHWESIGEYQTGQNTVTEQGSDREVLEGSWENVGATIFERDFIDGPAVDLNGDEVGAPAGSLWNTDIKAKYYVDLIQTELGFSWETVDRIEVSENAHTRTNHYWDRPEDEEQYTGTAGVFDVSADYEDGRFVEVTKEDASGERISLGSFEVVGGQVDVGDATLTGALIGYRVETEKSETVRFYDEVVQNGGWYHNKFLGSMEKRDGFIEIRDQDWNTVARIADLTDSANLLAWAGGSGVSDTFEGLAASWDAVKSFLPIEALRTPESLSFTVDDNNIYAFTSDGQMVGQVNYWNDTGEWDQFVGNAQMTVRNYNFNYNFHDANWNNLANAGGNARFIVEQDGTEVLDESGTNVGFTLRKGDVDLTEWLTYNPNDVSETIDFDDVVEIRIENRNWSSEVSAYRGPEDQWSDSSEQIQYFVGVEGQNWTNFVGSKETRDGFIEIRDEYWNVVSKKVDGGEVYHKMANDIDGFESAWIALESTLPSDWVADVNDGTGGSHKAYKGFKYTTDQWDNILIFDTTGEMIGQIHYWSHSDVWDRTWDAAFPKEKHSNSGFNFQKVNDTGNNWNWVSIGEFQIGNNTYFAPNEDPAVDAGVVDSSWENVGSTLYARDMGAAWDTTVKGAYFIDMVEAELGFGWADVDRVEVSDNEYTRNNLGWETPTTEVEESENVRFYEELEMPGGWFQSRFLGSIEKRDGFIEIRDENWDTVARVVDVAQSLGFDDIKGDYPNLEWAWTEVRDFLPDSAADPSALVFTKDGEHIYAFDDTGAMVVQVNLWKWTYTDEGSVDREESNYNYNFQDENWKDFASAQIRQEFVSDDTNDRALDRESTSSSFRVRRDDVSEAEWAAFDPNDQTGTIVWSEIGEIAIGESSWGTFANFNRSADNTYSGSEQRVEYFEMATDRWGNSWPEFVGAIETQGNLSRVYDEEWELQGSQTSGDLTGPKLSVYLNNFESELLAQFNSIISKYVDPQTVELIESQSGDDLLVSNGVILATVSEDFTPNTAGTRADWQFRLRDINGENIMDLGGWNALDGNGDLEAKPNGVEVREYLYKDQLSDAEWQSMKDALPITTSGFNWNDVGLVVKKSRKDDHDGDGNYTDETQFQFVKVDPVSGRQDWEYFSAEPRDGLIFVYDHTWTQIDTIVPGSVAEVPLTHETALGAGFERLLDAAIDEVAYAYGRGYDAPSFDSKDEFTFLGGNTVKWTSSLGLDVVGYVPETLFGEIYFQDGEFEIKFKRPDGEPLIEFGGTVSIDDKGEPTYADVDVFVRTYDYKTDLSGATPTQNLYWQGLLDEFGPTSALSIPTDVEGKIELIEINTHYRLMDMPSSGSESLSGIDGMSMPLMLEEDNQSARFVLGEIDVNTGDLDLFWASGQEYRIEFRDGFEQLYQGSTLLGMSIARDDVGSTPYFFVDEPFFSAETALGMDVLSFFENATFGASGVDKTLSNFIPGFDGADVELISSSDGGLAYANVTTGEVLAIAEFNYAYSPDDYGGKWFSVDFKRPDGHPLVGFSGYTSTDNFDQPDFLDYGLETVEYLYRSDVSESDWLALKAAYGPTADLVFDWTEVELLRIRTDFGEEGRVPNSALAPTSEDRVEVRFIEGEYNDAANVTHPLTLFFDNERVEVEFDYANGVEILSLDNVEDTVAVSRDITLTQVESFDTDFSDGFIDLINDTGVMAGAFTDQSGLTFQVDEDDQNTPLYVSRGGDLRAVFADMTADWMSKYGDTELGYEMYSSEGHFLGWFWQSPARTFIDLNGTSHEDAVSKAYNLNVSMQNGDLTLEGWKYLNDTFKIPNDAGFDFYDVERVSIRHEFVENSAGEAINEHIYAQYHVPGIDGHHRVGFDLTNGKSYTFGPGDWPDPTDVDGYATYMATVASDATTVDVTGIKIKVAEIMGSLYGPGDLGDDFYGVDIIPDSNVDTMVDAYALGGALDDYKAIVRDGSYDSDDGAASADGTDFIYEVVVGGQTVHALTIASDVTGFGTMLYTYYDSSANWDYYDLADLVDDLPGFVEEALLYDGVDLNAADAADIAYAASYAFNGTPVQTVSVEDAAGFMNYEPLSHSPTSNPNDDEVFLISPNDDGSVWVYTPDDQFSMTVTGIPQLAAGLMADPNNTLSPEDAPGAALEEFLTQMFAEDDAGYDGLS